MIGIYTKKYHISMQLMHWLMAFIILGMIGIGWYMSGLAKDNPLRDQLVTLHKSFGSLVLILFFVRVSLRFSTTIKAIQDNILKIERRLADSAHFLLYALMLIVPLSGYGMSNMYGYNVKMFGLEMPKIFPTNKAFAGIAHEAHEILPYILLTIIFLHVAGALKHRFFDKVKIS